MQPQLALNEKLRRREEFRGVVWMCIPTVITICSRMVMDLTDFYMVSHLGPTEGPRAQAAILPAQVVVWTFIVLGFSTVAVVNTFVAQCIGRGRPRDAGAYAWQAVYLALAYGVLGAAFRPFLPVIFKWVGHAEEVRVLEIAYAQAIIWTIGPSIGAEALVSFFNGIHKPRVPMWTALTSNIVNVAAGLPLIFGLFGLPKLGMVGAAWGTMVGVSFRFLRLLYVFLSERNAAEYGTRSAWRPNLAKFGACLRVGLPQGMQSFSDVFVWMVFITLLIGREFGGAHLVATNIAWQYLRIAFMPAFGLGIALASLVGKAIGQRDLDRAMRTARTGAAILIAYMSVLAFCYFFFRRQLIGIVSDNPEVITIGSHIMICVVIFQMFDGLGIIYQFALRGAGDTFWPAVASGLAHWSFVVGGGFLAARLHPEWGSLGPWAAATALLVFLGTLLWWRWRSRAWQKIDIFKHERPKGPVATDETAIDEESIDFQPTGLM